MYCFKKNRRSKRLGNAEARQNANISVNVEASYFPGEHTTEMDIDSDMDVSDFLAPIMNRDVPPSQARG